MMVARKRIGALVIGAVLFLAGMWVHAQTTLPPREGRPAPQLEPSPTIVAGNDLGFRIDSRKGGTPVGRFVVRINGQWVEVEEAVGVKRLTTR